MEASSSEGIAEPENNTLLQDRISGVQSLPREFGRSGAAGSSPPPSKTVGAELERGRIEGVLSEPRQQKEEQGSSSSLASEPLRHRHRPLHSSLPPLPGPPLTEYLSHERFTNRSSSSSGSCESVPHSTLKPQDCPARPSSSPGGEEAARSTDNTRPSQERQTHQGEGQRRSSVAQQVQASMSRLQDEDVRQLLLLSSLVHADVRDSVIMAAHHANEKASGVRGKANAYEGAAVTDRGGVGLVTSIGGYAASAAEASVERLSSHDTFREVNVRSPHPLTLPVRTMPSSPIPYSSASDDSYLRPIQATQQYPATAPSQTPSPLSYSPPLYSPPHPAVPDLRSGSRPEARGQTRQTSVPSQVLSREGAAPVSPTASTRTQSRDQSRPFRCSQCSAAFNRRHDLSRHVRIHEGIRPYFCTQCGRGFSRQDALARHHANARGTCRPHTPMDQRRASGSMGEGEERRYGM
ncbi:uncharacterized protein SPPG_05607 [Spizellomyces punctatus DAOM BR117]|uniref:C2H2-type domain-containing protein n=1 Tax=Spizellomyces punctatus (strain DAOM BR117) TaxID=645134 RepID=A0A0L0HE27_SPIPD|nr:uncharacterized protein SPPG_05607 [Spizellomyces punctatus DAOM BR117]KNC99362.1 hypothetical protein SPPG_05607 [Spizellomyces punctatus DAOM BR117]|eukprot:XP_016607402.1 hypothetical protein SPPG_05607 [Spizellomyces punctatus DAOM BR117]